MGIRLVVRSAWSSDGSTSEHLYEFDQARVVVGRGAGADVRLPHPAVSTQHATIRSRGAGWVVQDEGSTNGTRVEGARLPPGRPKPLKNGDRIELGGFDIVFEGGQPVAAATSVDRTSALARRIVRDILDPQGSAPTSPRLLVLNGPEEGRTLEVPEPPARLVIGRGDECDLRLSDADASREHAEVESDIDGVVLRDLDSKNGLKVNDRRVTERRLKDRDEIVIGATALVFEDPAEQRLRELLSEPDLETEPPSLRDARTAEAAEEGDAGANDHGRAPAASPESGEPNDAGTAAADPTVEPTPAPRTAEPARGAGAGKRRRGPGADLVIYLLAAAVLALSIAGLVILLQSG